MRRRGKLNALNTGQETEDRQGDVTDWGGTQGRRSDRELRQAYNTWRQIRRTRIQKETFSGDTTPGTQGRHRNRTGTRNYKYHTSRKQSFK